MRRVNGDQFYQLSIAVHPLTSLRIDEKLLPRMFDLDTARDWLKSSESRRPTEDKIS